MAKNYLHRNLFHRITRTLPSSPCPQDRAPPRAASPLLRANYTIPALTAKLFEHIFIFMVIIWDRSYSVNRLCGSDRFQRIDSHFGKSRTNRRNSMMTAKVFNPKRQISFSVTGFSKVSFSFRRSRMTDFPPSTAVILPPRIGRAALREIAPRRVNEPGIFSTQPASPTPLSARAAGRRVRCRCRCRQDGQRSAPIPPLL